MSLEVRDARWRIGEQAVLDGVDLSAPVGGLVGLLGPNGSGKSSLLRVIAGVVDTRPPRAGGPDGAGSHRRADGRPHAAVTWNGTDLLRLRSRERARLVAFVEQDAHTDLDLTVREVVALGRTPHRDRWSRGSIEDTSAVDRALAAVGLLEMDWRRLSTLSGGERQRAHLGRGLAQEPEVLLLDEPTNHLDIQAQLVALGLVQRATRTGVTAVVAIHDLNLAATYCESIVLLDQGRVAASGTAAEVLQPEVIDAVYGVSSTVLSDPRTGAPVLTFRSR